MGLEVVWVGDWPLSWRCSRWSASRFLSGAELVGVGQGSEPAPGAAAGQAARVMQIEGGWGGP